MTQTTQKGNSQFGENMGCAMMILAAGLVALLINLANSGQLLQIIEALKK